MSMSMEEAGDKCFGQQSCDGCPRYGDDCDGKEKEDWEQEDTFVIPKTENKIKNWERLI